MSTRPSPNGRKVSLIPFTDGTIVTTGTAHWWAAIDGDNSRLLAHGHLASTPREDYAGNRFNMQSFSIGMSSE